MTRRYECLPCNHEKLSLTPQHPHESYPDMITHHLNSRNVGHGAKRTTSLGLNYVRPCLKGIHNTNTHIHISHNLHTQTQKILVKKKQYYWSLSHLFFDLDKWLESVSHVWVELPPKCLINMLFYTWISMFVEFAIIIGRG